MNAVSLMERGLDRMRELMRGDKDAPPTPRELGKLREQLRECVEGLGGEVSRRARAVKLGQTYQSLGVPGRHEFLRIIALEFGPDPKRIAQAHEAYQAAVNSSRQWDAEADLRGAMRSSRIKILTLFNALPQGIKFLVEMREDLIRYLKKDSELAALDRELEARLSAWFDEGFLELQRISWNSPAALLEKLIRYEAVHEIRSWNDLRNRLDSDRRCYAFFHPRMPSEPLIFVEVALTHRMAGSVQTLLDESAPVFENQRADTAIFYSISNTQPGLRGVSFGNFLLKRVIDDLKREFPKLKTFATLSPVPKLISWVRDHPEVLADAEVPLTLGELEAGAWLQDEALCSKLKTPLTRLAARYIIETRDEEGRPFDPVARFHLGNGARLERVELDG